jgi:hypothetical protein
VQSDDVGKPDYGNLEVVAVRTNGAMQHSWRDAADRQWRAGAVF